LTQLDDLSRATFIGLNRTEEFITAMQAFGLNLTAAQFRYNSSCGNVLYELVRQGLGVSILTRDVETYSDTIVPLFETEFHIPIPVWLVTHRELHTSKRIRIVYDILAEELSKGAFN
jgi:DNA-binding transcriptional LysR family regulator